MVVSVRHSTQMASLHHQASLKISSIVKQFKQYIPATVYWRCKKPFGQVPPVEKRSFNSRRLSRLAPQDKSSVLRTVLRLCQLGGSFTSLGAAMEAKIAENVHHTVRKVLNTANYHYCRSCKKGLLQAADVNVRLEFPKSIRT